MLKYTRASIDIIIADLRRYYNIFKYVSRLAMIAYFIFAIIAGLGLFPVNIAMLSLISLYSLVELIFDFKHKKLIRRSYKWLIIILRAISLGFVVYGVYETSEKATPLAIILITLMIIFWLAQIIFEIIVEIFEDKRDLFLAAVHEDFKETKEKYGKPIETVKNVFNFIRGKESEPVDEEEKDSREVKILKKHLAKEEK